MACVLGLLFLSWTAVISNCHSADLDFSEVDVEEDLPDMNYVKAQAEAGRPRSQTQLADFYLALSDFTNAIPWYQKAAEQNYVPAQLSLAGCLLSGRGTGKDPATASQWLRRAADLIEARKTTTILAARGVLPLALPSVVRTPPTVVTQPAPGTIASNFNIISTNTNFPRPASVDSTTRTNLSQVRRINTLLAAEPDLLEIPTGLRPPSDSR